MGSLFLVQQAIGWCRVRLPVVVTKRFCTMSSQRLWMSPPASLLQPLSVPDRLLLGPGPSNSPPRVLSAGSRQLIGHLHKELIQVRTILPTSPKISRIPPSISTHCFVTLRYVYLLNIKLIFILIKLICS